MLVTPVRLEGLERTSATRVVAARACRRGALALARGPRSATTDHDERPALALTVDHAS